MKTRLSFVFSLVCLMVMPVLAHHSFDAEYDSTKTLTIVGFVTKVDWVNPHAFVYLDSKDARRNHRASGSKNPRDRGKKEP